MQDTIKQFIKAQISQIAEGVPFDILIPPDSRLGDYSTNLPFKLAKKTGRDPKIIARECFDAIKDKIGEVFRIDKMSSISGPSTGYLNFFLKSEFLQNQLKELSKNETYGQSDEGKGKKVIVEYSSPNIAKPMHIGHLRSTIIGDALANVYDELGFTVVRWNFLGDWGTQFGKLISAYKKWGKENPLELMSIQNMVDLYVRFSTESKDNLELEKEGQNEFKKLEEGDSENNMIWHQFMARSVKYFLGIYEELGISIFSGKKDVSGQKVGMLMNGESHYEPKLKPLIEELQKKGLAKESEGALIIDLGDMPPMMLRKTDGATLYATRDIASLEDRITNYHPDKILYVVANQQALHFEQLFAVAKKLGWTETELVHVKFGMVLGEDGKKLATREGKVVPLQEVIDKVTEMARETVKQKNSNLSGEEMEKVAHVVAIGALKYNDLKQHPYSDIEFDWKAMLDLSGNSGPYIQYTYARLANILNKVSDSGEGDTSLLTELSERMLMRQLLDYPEAVKECAERYALNGLALYLYDLAHRANQFYEQVHVLEDENIERRDARLVLIKTVARTLKDGLALLGIETLERI